jgi:hypothetical protein
MSIFYSENLEKRVEGSMRLTYSSMALERRSTRKIVGFHETLKQMILITYHFWSTIDDKEHILPI